MDEENTSYRINIEENSEKFIDIVKELTLKNSNKKDEFQNHLLSLEQLSNKGYKCITFSIPKRKFKYTNLFIKHGFEVTGFNKTKVSFGNAKFGKALDLKENYKKYVLKEQKKSLDEFIEYCDKRILETSNEGDSECKISYHFYIENIDKILNHYTFNGFKIKILNKFKYYFGIDSPEFIISW